jgi:putative copper export protein
VRALRALTLVAVAAWLGIMAFFSFGVAPLVFQTIDRAVAGKAVAAVLPRYYSWGIALCAVALAAAVVQLLSAREGRLRPLVSAALCGAMLGLLAWSSAVVLPDAEAARRTRDDRAFARAHRASVRLNGATMVAGALLLVVEGLSPGRRRGR